MHQGQQDFSPKTWRSCGCWIIVGNLRKKRRYSTFPLQDNIDITLGHTASLNPALAWPLHLEIMLSNRISPRDLGPPHLDGAKLPEGLRKALVSEVPGDTTQEDFGGVEGRSLTPSRCWQLTRPSAGSLTYRGSSAILLGCPFQGKRVSRGMESTRQKSTSREGREVVRWNVLTRMSTQLLPRVGWRHARQAKQGLQKVWALNRNI